MKKIVGNLLDSDAQYIAHQCNCVTRFAAHLAKAVFDQFPYANVYWGRKSEGKLGTIAVHGNGKDERFVVAMFAQYFQGQVRYPNSKKDNHQLRQESFWRCLYHVSQIKGLKSIAFPYGIGCGAAGGDWEVYEKMLKAFDERVDAEVIIVKLNGQ